MKRSVLALILILCAFFMVHGQNTPMDVILVLDTSSGMGSSYENVSSYITGPFLSEYLRVRDTFHLIVFSGSPRLDIARRVIGVGDVETIIGRMLIQYPIENGSNIGSAISFTEQYAASLPSRPKKIVVVSTGGGDTNNLVGAARQRLSSRNASIDFVQVTPGQPLANTPSSGRPSTPTSVSTPVVTTPSTTVPAVTTPSTTSPAVTAPSTTSPAVTSPSTTSPAITDPSTASPAVTAPSTTAPAVTTPASPSTAQQTQETAPAVSAAQTGTAAAPVTPETSTSGTETAAAIPPANTGVSGTDNTVTNAAVPSENTGAPAVESQARETAAPSPLQPVEQKSGTAWTSSMPFIIGIIILALIILGIIVFFATRRLGSSPNRVIKQAASSKPVSRDDKTPIADNSKDLAKYAAVQNRQRSTPYDNRPIKTESVKNAVINPSGPLLLNLFVEDQNTAIGKRNIHSLKSGYSLSVGGGQSDFLIFLVPIPANIGEIHRDGSQCSFIPKKPKYFPDLGSNELRDCINKTIRVISDKNYELRFRFEMYEDPLVALNRVLMSVSVPG